MSDMKDDDNRPPTDSPVFKGVVLTAIGLLWIVLSGLCTAPDLSALASNRSGNPQIMELYVFGGAISIGIGLVIFVLGLRLLSRARRNKRE